jgi:rhamnosyltransferase
MEAKTSQRWDRLDHLRCLAAFMVFAWHFTHAYGEIPATQPSWVVLFEEGHTGVALFMVLSGYLFARIIGDRTIDYWRFLHARLWRLGPLLLLGLAAAYVAQPQRWTEIPLGLVLPVWENGCWSIAAELQFYALLPVLFLTFRWSPAAVVVIIVAALAGRTLAYAAGGDLKTLAYYSLVGRIDQFVLGMATWRMVRDRRVAGSLFVVGFSTFLVALHAFDLAGGLVGLGPSPAWIVWPTIEGLGYSLLVAWYAGGSWSFPSSFAFVGRVSYSIYIWHFLFVGPMALFALNFLHVQNVYLMLALSIPAFIALLPLAWVSWRVLERPFIGSRHPYLRAEPVERPLAGFQDRGLQPLGHPSA